MAPRIRKRWRLVLLLVLVGVPLAIGGILAWFLTGGRLERRVEREYADRFPGTLSVGSIELTGAQSVTAHDLAVAAPGSDHPVVRAGRIDAAGGLMPPRLGTLVVDGLRVDLDQGALSLLRAFAEQPQRGSSPASPISFRVAGSALFGGELPLDGLQVDLQASGPSLAGTIGGTLAGKPLSLRFEPTAKGFHLRVERLGVDLTRLWKALDALDAIDDDDVEHLDEWVPPAADADGTVLEVDSEAGTVSGELRFTWEGGHGGGRLALDRAGLVIEGANADDADLGRAEGRLGLRFAERRLDVTVPTWTPGPKVPIPSRVPIESMLALLPVASLTVTREPLPPGSPRPTRPHIDLRFLPADARRPERAGLEWLKGEPLRVTCDHLPLPLVQHFLPDQVVLAGGELERLDFAWHDQPVEVACRARGARVRIAGWEFGAADANLVVTPLADRPGFATVATITDESAPGAPLVLASLRHEGLPESATVAFAIDQLGELVRRSAGKQPLPAVEGRLRLSGDYRLADGGAAGKIDSIAVDGLAVPNLLREFATVAHGQYSLADGALSLDLTGQLSAGKLWLPSTWLDLAAQTPIYKLHYEAMPAQADSFSGMARAAGAHGDPVANGFTARIDGHVVYGDFLGDITGVVDRADLGWLRANTSLVPLPADSQLAGEGATTFALRFDRAGVSTVAGYFLPLNTDVKLLHGDLEITGVTGSVRFHVTRPAVNGAAP